MKNKTLKSRKDIKVGQFYKSPGIDEFYYVGMKWGGEKFLSVIDLEKEENNTICPIDGWFFRHWKLVECDQKEVMENVK